MDEYKHLDKDTPFRFDFDSDQIAKVVVKTNYGVHRLLCAIIKERRTHKDSEDLKCREQYGIDYNTYPDELADELQKLIERGLF